MGAGLSLNGLQVIDYRAGVSARHCRIGIEINIRFSCDC